MDLVTINTSSVIDLACPLRFWTLRIERQWPPREAPSPNREFGLALHEILAAIYNPDRQPLPYLDDLDLQTRRAFASRQYADPILKDRDLDACLRLARQYAEQDPDGPTTVAVEIEGRFRIHHKGEPLFLLHAKLDRVIANEDELIIRDYKTSTHSVAIGQMYVLMSVGAMLFPGFRRHTLQIDFLDRSDISVQRCTVSGAELKGVHRDIVERVIRFTSHHEKGEHPAIPGSLCPFCHLRPECQPDVPIYMDSDDELFEAN